MPSACAPARTAFRSPWQNGIAERWVGSVRRELLDHSVVFNERHLRRLLGEYVAYYHQDRTHYALEKETPGGRLPSASQGASAAIVARRRLALRCPNERDRHPPRSATFVALTDLRTPMLVSWTAVLTQHTHINRRDTLRAGTSP